MKMNSMKMVVVLLVQVMVVELKDNYNCTQPDMFEVHLSLEVLKERLQSKHIFKMFLQDILHYHSYLETAVWETSVSDVFDHSKYHGFFF